MRKDICVIVRSQVKRIVDLTEEAIGNSWKSRLDESIKESLINVLSGNGTKEDFENIKEVVELDTDYYKK